MDKWTTREFRVNLVLAAVTLLAGIICLVKSGSDGMVPEYATCLKHGGKMLIVLAVAWVGMTGARKAITAA